MKLFISIILCSAIISGCMEVEHKQGFNVHFFRGVKDSSEVYLFIDGEKKGVLPHLNYAPECNDPFLKKALMISLESGKYKVEVKDRTNNVLFAQRLGLKGGHRSTQVSSSIKHRYWSSTLNRDGSCITDEIFY